jgi:tetratricopeptide (TPR) repeat protein
LLGAFYGREYMTGFGTRPDDLPPLDRALRAARRGVELKPQSSRAYHVLFTIQFARGDKDAGIAAAEKSIALNPYDLLATAEYGGRLIYCGEIDRGMQILQDSVGSIPVLPSWSHFALFVGHYIRGDLAQARFHASQLSSETYVFHQLARALIAHVDGDEEEAERAARAILALQPAWGTDPRREIGKLIKAQVMAGRLSSDFAAIAGSTSAGS